MKRDLVIALTLLAFVTIVGTFVTFQSNLQEKKLPRQAERKPWTQRPPQPATQEEKEKAIAVVRAFMSQPDLPLKFPGNADVKTLERGLRIVVLTNENSTDVAGFGDKTFIVELKRNYVLQAYFRDAVYRSTTPYRFFPNQSESLATAFAERHFPNFSAMHMTLKKRNTPDEMVHIAKSYEFVWRSENTPSWVSVIISPVTGEVISYYTIYDDSKIDAVPKITKEQALKIARREIHKGRFGPSISQVKEAGLYVSYGFSNKPTMVWGFEFEGQQIEFNIESIITPPNPVPVVEVDALTGNISYVGPSQ